MNVQLYMTILVIPAIPFPRGTSERPIKIGEKMNNKKKNYSKKNIWEVPNKSNLKLNFGNLTQMSSYLL
jgi:hypothetical protein